MALSGSYTFYRQNYTVDLVFSWTATQNITANTSTVNWKLYLTGSSSNGNGMFGIGTFKINNSVVYQVSRGQPELDTDEVNRLANLPLNTGIITQGTFTVNHNSTGEGSFTFEGTGESPYYVCFGPTPFQLEQGITGKQTFTLNSIPRASKVSATNVKIPGYSSITVTRYISTYTHTIDYKFGSQTGNIVTKSSETAIEWYVPISLFEEIPNDRGGTVTLTITTYNGNTVIGTSTGTLTFSAEDAYLAPVVNPKVTDVNSTTMQYTGDARGNTLIRHQSMVEYNMRTRAQHGATIVSQSVTCGSVTQTGKEIGTIENVESGTFVFTVTDSRGYTTTKTLEKTIINYVKPTCYQEVETTLAGTTGAEIAVRIKGNYFDGSFGAVSNTFQMEIRYTQPDGQMGAWQILPDVMFPVLSDDTYTLDITLTGLSYDKSYEIQSRITDIFHTVQSSIYTAQVMPVYDWDKDDFNFNVPVCMNGETILRHNKEANNLVVSASGGSIYFRPAGTNSTSTEMRLNQNGDLVLNGTLIVDGVDIIQALRNANII